MWASIHFSKKNYYSRLLQEYEPSFECRDVPNTSCTPRVEQECKTVLVDNCRWFFIYLFGSSLVSLCFQASISSGVPDCSKNTVPSCHPAEVWCCLRWCLQVKQKFCLEGVFSFVDYFRNVPEQQCRKVPQTSCVSHSEQLCSTVHKDSCR